MPTDKQRLDFLSNLPTCKIIKEYSTNRGAHWPWTIKIVGSKISFEHDDFRDAVDQMMKENPYWIKKDNE